jgi:hypothetical protein
MTRIRGPLGLFPARLLALAVVVGLALVGGMAVSPARPVHAASEVQLFLGYADTLRADPARFPTPWAGSPDVVFAGCQPQSSCTFDSGAARLVNNTNGAVTIDSVVIKFDACTYDIWPHGTVLQPGKQLVVTQTGGGSAHGCTPEAGVMDSSDIGPNGVNWVGHCDQSGIIPEVDVSVNGAIKVFRDTGQVLNTGGVDLADCPPGTNESTQWTLVGSAPCPGASLTLAPPSQTLPVGSLATVQATLRNTCNDPLAGAPVHFQILSGPNGGGGGNGVTDANGVATFSYSSATPGTDTLQASVTNPAGTLTSNTVVVIWQAVPLMTGRAYGIASSGLVNIPPTPDTGPVATVGASTVAPPCVLTITGVVTAHTLCAKVVTALGPSRSTATASLQDVRIGLTGMPVIQIGVVQSSSQTTCAGAVGGTTILSITVGGVPTRVNSHPAANTTLNAPGLTIIVNEQLHVVGADQGLTVNAVHIILPGVLDVVIASSTSDIHRC